MNCLECGKDLFGKWQQKYCSHPCSLAHQRKERRAESEAKRRRVCVSCGKEFIMGHPSAKANRGEIKAGLYCSRKCTWDAQRKPKDRERRKSCRVYVGKCTICGMMFTSRHKRARCGRSCDLEHGRRESLKASAAKKDLKTRKCKECGKLFVPQYGDKRRSFCSEFCNKKNVSRKAKGARRARIQGGNNEAYDPIEILNRDRWTCQLCGCRTPRRLRGTVRDSAPEVDHIIPLSRGGEHSMRNAQCLCRKCNQKKGATTLGQLRLFG